MGIEFGNQRREAVPEAPESACDREARLRRAFAIAAEMRAAMGSALPSSDHAWLYDEDGLPR